jgi:hypothetical protein
MRKNKLGDFILNMVADHVDNEIVAMLTGMAISII